MEGSAWSKREQRHTDAIYGLLGRGRAQDSRGYPCSVGEYPSRNTIGVCEKSELFGALQRNEEEREEDVCSQERGGGGGEGDKNVKWVKRTKRET